MLCNPPYCYSPKVVGDMSATDVSLILTKRPKPKTLSAAEVLALAAERRKQLSEVKDIWQ